MEEATELSDRIVMIHQGQVVYAGAPKEVVSKATELNGSLDTAYRHYVDEAVEVCA